MSVLLRRKITAEELLYALKDYTKSQVKIFFESMDSSSFIKLLEQCHYEQFVSRDDRELLRMAIEKGLNVNFKSIRKYH